MRTYLYAIIAIIILFFAQTLGGIYDLYIRFPGYDIPMHILGGVGIGFSIVAVLRTLLRSNGLASKLGKNISSKKFYSLTIFFVFLGGFLWELFEAYYNIAGAPVGSKAYYIDTVKDLMDDTIGGIIVILSEIKRAR